MFNPFHRRISNIRIRLLSLLITSVMLLLTEWLTSPLNSTAYAHNDSSQALFPPGAQPYGLRYAEWSGRWWQWALSIPAASNPLLDPSGDHCAESQTGSVWYLAGTFGGSFTRHCTVPSTRPILFPVANTIFGAAVGDCTGPADCDIQVLRRKAFKNLESASNLSARLDSVSLPNPKAYRATSPVFPVLLPANAIFGLPQGNFQPNVSDGYWMMLRPLTVGAHSLHFHADFPDSAIDVTYNLTVN